MEYTVAFEDGTAHVATSGVAALDGFLGFIAAVVDDPRFRPGTPILIDHTALQVGSLMSVDVRAIADAVLDLDVRIGSSPVAIVAPGNALYGLKRMFGMLTESSPMRLALFRTRDEAAAWLLETRM